MAHKWNHNFPKIAREAGFVIKELSVGHCIDWRFIASIDPYAIVGDKDYEKLDEFIPHIAEVPIGTVLNNRILDPAIGKYFILAQFSIQYLLFCKRFLDETVVEIRNTAQDVQKENSRLEKICRKKNEEIVSLHRKLQRAESAHAQQMVFPCSKCTKNFISLELLNAHMARKHAEMGTSVATSGEPKPAGRKLSETDSNLINTIKLELEVKQLKERLNATEKDLMDQRSRDREHCCHATCIEDRGKDKDWRPPKVVECCSVAIQSNLEDAKDVNEKEVQTSVRSHSETPPRLSPISRFSPSPTRPALPPVVHSPPPPPQPRAPLDYISKSELESIVREQSDQFENWKQAERLKFNSEIEKVRQNLTDAIRELEKRDRMVAAAAPVINVTAERNEENDNIWKKRYRELEQMYENSQRQVRETVETIESAYEEKFRRIEQMVERQKETTANEVKPDQTKRVIDDSSLLQIPVPRIDLKSSLPPALSRATFEYKVNEVEVQQDSTPGETDQSESDEEIRALEAAKAKLLSRSNVSAPAIEESKEKPIVSAPEKPLISPKKLILNTFKTRLKQLGIDTKTKAISKEDLNAATETLAERRDVSKRQNRGFFITRNQLMTKVDQLARSRLGEAPKPRTLRSKTVDQPIVRRRETPAQPVPKLRSTFQVSENNPVIDILPSKLKLVNEDRPTVPKPRETTSNLFKTRTGSSLLVAPEIKLTSDDVITVHAEINPLAETLSRSPVPSTRTSPRPSVSDHDRHVERLLDTPIKRLSTSPDVITVESSRRAIANDSDLSDILEAVPLQPKPIPKKRVLFNLDRDTAGGAVEMAESTLNMTKEIGPKLSSTVIQVSKAEEDSDWNISSFDDEK